MEKKRGSTLYVIIFLISVSSFILIFVAMPPSQKTTATLQTGILSGNSQNSFSANNTITAMPSYNVTVGGRVFAGVVAVSNGTVKISAFDSVSYAPINSSGSFQATINIPSDTPDGLYLVGFSFISHGQYGPSSNYTWVNVVREPLNFTISAPSIVVSGLVGTITGKVLSNGSAVPNCAVSISLPWDIYYGKTDSSGDYKISISVPLVQFSPVAQVIVTANPQEPYFETVRTTQSIGLFNPAELIVPAIIVGVVLYEIKNLELLSKKEVKLSIDELNQKIESIRRERRTKIVSSSSEWATEKGELGSKVFALYNQALELAEERFHVRLSESLTIRQTIEKISKLSGGEKTKGVTLFSEIALIVEDYFYSKFPNEPLVAGLDALVQQLREEWKDTEKGK